MDEHYPGDYPDELLRTLQRRVKHWRATQGPLKELFARVVFNVATANRDDHLRNHGFIRKLSGWIIAPAFDMNPSFKKDEHALAIDTDQHDPDIQTVINTAPFYRLSEEDAHEIVKKILRIISGWRNRTRRPGLSSLDCTEAEHLFLEKMTD